MRIMEINRRFFTERSVKDEDARVMTFTASDESRDSYGTVLNSAGWDLTRFKSNPVIGYQHNIYDSADPDNIIGKGDAYVSDGKLMVDVTFEPADINEVADKVWKKLQFGSLNGVSVGFVPQGQGSWGKGEEAPGGKTPTYYYAGQELLEISVVNIPANPNALKNAMQGEMDRLEKLLRQEIDDEAAKKAEEEAKKAEAAKAKAELDKTKFLAETALQL